METNGKSDNIISFVNPTNLEKDKEKCVNKLLPKTSFSDIEVSTKTIIATTNINVDIEKLFEYLPTVNYIIIPKKRGRKKKEIIDDPNKNIESGSIITLKYQDKIKGINLKKKKNMNKKYFRNALTVVMVIDGKKINFKISQNGKFQITGSKRDFHAEKCIEFIWKLIRDDKEDIYYFDNNHTELSATFLTVMTNIDFNVGFLINRENLDKFINNNTKYNSLLETSFGYTGVNIKFPMTENLSKDENFKLNVLVFKDNGVERGEITYGEHLNTLSLKEREKNINKKRYNTFLIFHSGNVIMSGMTQLYMEKVYYEFLNIIEECKDYIEERLE